MDDNKFNLPGVPVSLLHLGEPVKSSPNSSLEIVKIVSKWCDEWQQRENLLSLLLLRECPAQFNISEIHQNFHKNLSPESFQWHDRLQTGHSGRNHLTLEILSLLSNTTEKR